MIVRLSEISPVFKVEMLASGVPPVYAGFCIHYGVNIGTVLAD